MNEKYTNIYYVGTLNVIGGIETFLYELVRKYKDRDLTIFYDVIPDIQLDRLRRYVRCIKYTGQHIKCKKAFFNNCVDAIDNIEADEYIQFIHGDYKGLGWVPKTSDKITKYYAVSQTACDSFKELTGKDCSVCYNPITLDKPKRVLKLISATRLTKEKGKNRMIRLANTLTKAKIPYIWVIFTDDVDAIDNPNVCYMKPTLEVRDYIAQADYVVQLSNTEAYSYTILESLMMGIPVIVTPVHSFYEQGINENNSIVIDFDMKNIPTDKIYEKHFDFTYKPRKDIWDKLLVEEKSSYQERLKYDYIVEATDLFEKKYIIDKELGHTPKPKEEWKVDYSRLCVLLGDNPFNEPLVILKGKTKK